MQTSTTKDAEQIESLSLAEMIDELAVAKAEMAATERVVHTWQQAVIAAMQERGAFRAQTDAWAVKLNIPVSYDYSILAGLREITSPDEMVGYTPEHEVVKRVSESWNMTQAKTLAGLSSEHRQIIENAKIPGRPTLKLEAK